MTDKEIFEAIDFWSRVSDEALQTYKTAVSQHNYYQRLLLLKKLNNELENL